MSKSSFRKARTPVEEVDSPKAQKILHGADDIPAIINVQANAQTKKQISTDINQELSDKLDKISAHQDRSKRYIMRKVMIRYIKEYCEEHGL